MQVKNYTSTVPVERSIMMVEKLLRDAGALTITKFSDPKTKEVAGITFQIVANNQPLLFKLPVKAEACFEVIKRRISPRSIHKTSVLENARQQALRTAWKLLFDWVQIQMSYIELNQVELLEVFLSYAYNPSTDKTYFEIVKENNFKQLTQGK